MARRREIEAEEEDVVITKARIIGDFDADDFARFLGAPRLPEVMKKAGLAGPPEPVFVELIGEAAG